MDELIQAMSIDELVNFKALYPQNESIGKIVDGYIEVKRKEEAKAKAKADFETALEANQLPPPPDGVYNVYYVWTELEVEVEDTSQEPEEVEVIKTPAKLDKDGNVTKSAVTETELRYPMMVVKDHKWVVELNKATTVTGRSSAGQSPAASKRAKTVLKREGDKLVTIGNFTTAAKACEHLKIVVGGDSAIRILARNGYLLDDYDGTEFLA